MNSPVLVLHHPSARGDGRLALPTGVQVDAGLGSIRTVSSHFSMQVPDLEVN
jgi:hypothetical protein